MSVIHLHFEEEETENGPFLRCVVLDYDTQKAIPAFRLNLDFNSTSEQITGQMLYYETKDDIIQTDNNGKPIGAAKGVRLGRVTSADGADIAKKIQKQLIDNAAPVAEVVDTHRGIDMNC